MSGHGHVIPNADGTKARCGGPGICRECSQEAAIKANLKSATAMQLLDEYVTQFDVTKPCSYSPATNAGLILAAKNALDAVFNDGHCRPGWCEIQIIALEKLREAITAVQPSNPPDAAHFTEVCSCDPPKADPMCPVHRGEILKAIAPDLEATPRTDDWQTVRTAPRDGTAIQLMDADTELPVIAKYLAGDWIVCWDDSIYAKGNDYDLVWRTLNVGKNPLRTHHDYK